jgi:hypothetical protein
MDKIKRLQESIAELDINNLSVNKIETIICDFGLVYDKGCNYGEFKKYMVSSRKELGVYQTPRQLAECIFDVLKLDIHTYIEIGVFSGGNYLIMTGFLKLKNPEIKCVCVDITEAYMEPGTKPYLQGFVKGTSDLFIDQRFDLAFIDGGHKYKEIKKDWENVGKNAKYVIIHDINEPSCPDVKTFWNEIKPNLKFKEYLYQTNNNPCQGLALIENDNFFSVIIPTMWRSDLILEMLPVYENCDFVKEVIIIDNDPNSTPNLDKYSKVRHYTKGTNIYVNPAWNMGVALANYKIILANDDIYIADITDIFTAILNSDFDIIGAHIKTDNKGKRIEDISFMNRFYGKIFGCFMYIKNYTCIPDEIKIWYGDVLQFQLSPKKGRFMNFKINTKPSVTVKSNQKFRTIIENDVRIVNEMNERGEYLGKILMP